MDLVDVDIIDRLETIVSTSQFEIHDGGVTLTYRGLQEVLDRIVWRDGEPASEEEIGAANA